MAWLQKARSFAKGYFLRNKTAYCRSDSGTHVALASKKTQKKAVRKRTHLTKKVRKMIRKIKENSFLFSELVKRDFKKKYKRTYLGMLWSVLSPLLTLLIMSLVFTGFFGRNQPHYITYLFCGNIVFSFFSDATNGGMGAL